MAKSTSKQHKVRQFPNVEPPETPENEAVTAAMEPEGEPVTPFDEQAGPEAPPPPEKPKKTPKNLTFFERLATITPKEWEGDRAKVKVYRLAPLINRLVSSDHKYITQYDTPITEDILKRDHGSGRYRLYLNYKKPGQNEVEIDRVELDILDPKFPPNIPGNEWLDDPRNKSWAWARPANAPGGPAYQQNGQQQQPAPAADPLAALETLMTIQDRMEDRLRPAEQIPAAQAAAAPVDPWAAAEKILNMRADNPMMAILQEQMKLNAAAAEAERQRNWQAQEAAREREHKLQLQLLEAKHHGNGKSFMDQLLEMAANDKLEPIKKVFGIFNGNGGGEVAGRAARTTMLDVFRDLATGPAGATLAQGVASMISNLAAPRPAPGQQPQYPTVLNPQQANGTIPPVEGPEQRIQRIGATITRPLISHFLRGGEGQDFAQSMFDMNGDDYVFMRQLGAENILQRYRQFPEAWNYVQGEAPRFEEYIRAFCAWDPNEDEGPAPGPDDGVVDLESQEAQG